MKIRASKITPAEIIKITEKEKVRFINLQFTDLTGIMKTVTIPVEQFADCIERGKWFDGSAIEGFARILESDMYLKPDLDTFMVLPEKETEATARVICWIYTPKGELFTGDPRAVLAKAQNDARELGYEYRVAPEVEFFIFKPGDTGKVMPAHYDRGGYFDMATEVTTLARIEMVKAVQALGIRIEASHHEVAMGQHEIDLGYDNALRIADRIITLKYTVKAIAQKHGLLATFMPKPIFGLEGSGMHTHQSLIRLTNGQNAFADPADEYGLSELGKHFMAGQINHARSISAIVAPLVNSYKRVVSGFEAPIYISWARTNRSAFIRVPEVDKGKVETTRIELRSPDPSCNPYLAFAVMLKCGINGIKKKLPLPPPVEENLFAFDAAELKRRHIGLLPATLEEALEALRQDEVVQEALGEYLYTRFIDAKTIELDEYRKQVSPWELERYLETI
ncbi:MAG: type I glutamate--ammonia ligase [Dehalococcoidales bacterium]|nr:type I glutamate--ammonia ligase [Dehalococcoidales bacterium]